MKYRQNETLNEIMTLCMETMDHEEYREFLRVSIDELETDDLIELISGMEDHRHILADPDNSSIDQLTEKINGWHDDRSIVPNSSATVQCMKAVSELGELADNIIKHEDVKDSIGDVYVCLCSVARLSGVTVQDSIKAAYEDIATRTGTLLENGNFVKD